MIESSRKLVTLPNPQWSELREAGYSIPESDFSEQIYAQRFVNFRKFVQYLSFKGRRYLLSLLMEKEGEFDGEVAGRIALLFNEGSKNHELFTYIAEQYNRRDDSVPSSVPEAITTESETKESTEETGTEEVVTVDAPIVGARP